MCGEMSSETLYTEILLGMGLRKFSMNGLAIPKVKQLIRNTSIERSENLVKRVLEEHDTSKIIDMLKASRDEISKKE
jgi:phosphotransferase system enzyme I (PtsI)